MDHSLRELTNYSVSVDVIPLDEQLGLFFSSLVFQGKLMRRLCSVFFSSMLHNHTVTVRKQRTAQSDHSLWDTSVEQAEGKRKEVCCLNCSWFSQTGIRKPLCLVTEVAFRYVGRLTSSC